jgi:REP element-mobilizing transposase RayT
MGNHHRVETDKYANLITTRTRNSELWFVNNAPLEQAILGNVAKYGERHNVCLYALAIEGNHTHLVAQFADTTRARFMQDLNSNITRAVKRHVATYPGGSLHARRYSNEFLPDSEDTENWFFYTVLQPVKDGLVERIGDYPGYNCFHDAVWGIKRTYKLVDWAAYNEARRWHKHIGIKHFIVTYTLEYARLPGYGHLTQREYALLMHERLEERCQAIVAARRAEGKGFVGREALRKVTPGSRPRNTKTSTRNSHRPRVLSVCPTRRRATLDWYFTIYYEYKKASLSYRQGKRNTKFPPGTYKPYVPAH